MVRKKFCAVRLPQKIVKKLDQIATSMDMRRGELIRLIVMKYIEEFSSTLVEEKKMQNGSKTAS